MNPQSIAGTDDRAGHSAPARGQPSAKRSTEAGFSDQPLVPDYELLRRIGGGAYGEVWLARSKATGILRAAKIVWRRSFDDDRPFQREFEGIQRFERISREHPSQLALFHIGRNEAEGCFYYVMELADDVGGARFPAGTASAREMGRQSPSGSPHFPERALPYQPHTLRTNLGQGRLPAAQVLEIGLALTEALGHLHRNGLVHRDVKPSNVIFVNGRPKLADIGLVTDASDQCSIVGTEGYLPPEGPGTPQADIFALGKVLYEAATGLDRQKFPQLPPDLRQWPDAAQVFEFNEIILKACESDARSRYQKCEEIQRDLGLLHRGQSVRRQRTWAQRRVVGKKAGLALSALAVVAVLVFVLPRQSHRSAPSTDGPDSTNLQANALCDKAMYILRGDNYAEVGTALTNFYEAVALDPSFARPYVGLIELRLREDVNVPGMTPPTTDELRSFARHLEQLAPHLAAMHVAQAAINWSDQNFPESERCIWEAIKSNPKYELSYTFYSWLLDCYGRTDEALKQLEMARRLAPSKVIIYRAFGNTYYVARDYTNAIAWYQKAIRWEPHHSVAWWGVGASLVAMGDYTNALPYLERNEILDGADEAATKLHYALLRSALNEQGIRGFWTQHWKWAESDTNATLGWKAKIQIHLGNTNAALDLLEQSYDKHERGGDYGPPLGRLLFDPDWDGLHDNRRFKHLLDKIGFTKVMPPRKG